MIDYKARINEIQTKIAEKTADLKEFNAAIHLIESQPTARPKEDSATFDKLEAIMSAAQSTQDRESKINQAKQAASLTAKELGGLQAELNKLRSEKAKAEATERFERARKDYEAAIAKAEEAWDLMCTEVRGCRGLGHNNFPATTPLRGLQGLYRVTYTSGAYEAYRG